VIGQSRRFLAQKRDGSLVPIKLAVLEQRLGDARVFVGTLEPVDPGSPGSSPTSAESPTQISPVEDARLSSAPRSSAGSSEGRERLSPGASCSPLSDGSDIEALSLSTFGQISPDLVYALLPFCFGSDSLKAGPFALRTSSERWSPGGARPRCLRQGHRGAARRPPRGSEGLYAAKGRSVIQRL
jgi:hypothetical protein